MLTKRTNILFDRELWALLAAQSKVEKSSIGELVRRAVVHVYGDTNRTIRIAKARETILKERKKFRKIDYSALIDYGRSI